MPRLPAIPPSADISGQLLFLGTGTSNGVPMIGCNCETCTSTDPHNARTRCSVICGLPQGNLLIDTAPDLRTQLLREKIGLVHATLFTHDHADHLHGMDDLRLFPHYTGQPMPIYCEEAVEHRIRTVFSYAFDEYSSQLPAGYLPQLGFQRITPLEPFEVLGQRIIPFRLNHGRFLVLGFRIGNVAYCTDTNDIPPESLPHLADLDTLILDCLRPKPHPSHFGIEQVISLHEQLRPRRTLLTHISHALEHEATNALLPAGMSVAYDGLHVALV